MINNQEKRIINSCQTCRISIYEGEPIYASSKAQSSGYTKGAYGGRNFGNYQAGGYGGHYSGTHASENWAQCAWCYDQGQAELAANKRFGGKGGLGGLLTVIISTIISIVVFPGLEGGKSVTGYRMKIFSLGSGQIPLIAPIVLIVALFLVRILGNLLQPAVDRYKIRKRSTKKL